MNIILFYGASVWGYVFEADVVKELIWCNGKGPLCRVIMLEMFAPSNVHGTACFRRHKIDSYIPLCSRARHQGAAARTRTQVMSTALAAHVQLCIPITCAHAHAGVKFELAAWKDTGGFILKGSAMEEAQLLLDDHTIKSQVGQMTDAVFCAWMRLEDHKCECCLKRVMTVGVERWHADGKRAAQGVITPFYMRCPGRFLDVTCRMPTVCIQ